MNAPIYRVSLVRDCSTPCRASVRDSATAAAAFRPLFEGLDREQFAILLLDTKHKPIGFNVVSIGSLCASIVHPREVFKPAILASAAAIIACHNHPSGDPTPSAEDDQLTKRLRDAGEIIGIRLLDHVILGEDNSHFSYTDAGRW